MSVLEDPFRCNAVATVVAERVRRGRSASIWTGSAKL